MGIEPDIEFGNNCLCFEAGRTPKRIFLNFSGIQEGSIWFPGLPGSPNGTYVCTQGIPCSWTLNTPDFIFNYQTNLPGSQISVFNFLTGFFAFNFIAIADCVFAGANNIAVPLNKAWWGGKGRLAWQD